MAPCASCSCACFSPLVPNPRPHPLLCRRASSSASSRPASSSAAPIEWKSARECAASRPSRRVSDPRADDVAFAMNAGMFDDAGAPIGLLVEDGREVRAINRRKGGGNFHLMPNGVFLVRRNGRAEVVTTARFRPAPDIAFATQSGPMLVIDGKLHPSSMPTAPRATSATRSASAPTASPVRHHHRRRLVRQAGALLPRPAQGAERALPRRLGQFAVGPRQRPDG